VTVAKHSHGAEVAETRSDSSLPAPPPPPPPPPPDEPLAFARITRNLRQRKSRGSSLVTGLGVVAIAVGLVLVAAALVARGSPARAVRVDVIGDSLVHQARVPLERALAEAGYEANVVGLPAQSLESVAVRESLDVAARAGDDVLVVATAANDTRANAVLDGQWPSAPSYRADIVALLQRFGDRCLVVVNARDRTHPLYLPERAVVLNGELARLEREHANLVVVDWAARSRTLPPAAFSNDQLHFGDPSEIEQPDSPSSRAYAAAIVEGVARCPGRR
jgi:hypothetical protein